MFTDNQNLIQYLFPLGIVFFANYLCLTLITQQQVSSMHCLITVENITCFCTGVLHSNLTQKKTIFAGIV